ncbi:MAG: hemolysin family protein [Chloroflexota bacterium]
MNSSFVEIAVIVLLLLANGVFAMAEIAVVSARKLRLQRMAEQGSAQARTALELANHPNQFLATVQIGITLVGILAGAFGGATIAQKLAAVLANVRFLAAYSESIAVGLVVLVITYLSLVVGELAPKRVGLSNAERIAAAVAVPMKSLAAITRPIVRFLDISTDVVVRSLGIKPSDEPSITPEELKILIDQGTASGAFEEMEQDMIEKVLRLDERSISAVMTPRPQIIWFDVDDAPAQIYQKIAESQHSRFPVFQDTQDNVLGIVRVKDVLIQNLSGHSFDLRPLLRPVVFVPENLSVLEVLELFKQRGTHLALITDEYGSIEGMVTHNDILENIVGEIPIPGEPADPKAIRRDDGSWLIDGLLDIEEFKDTLQIRVLPKDDEYQYQTVGGFVISRLGSIPTAGQSFTWDNWHVEVVDMDGRRVDKVLVAPIKG